MAAMMAGNWVLKMAENSAVTKALKTVEMMVENLVLMMVVKMVVSSAVMTDQQKVEYLAC